MLELRSLGPVGTLLAWSFLPTFLSQRLLAVSYKLQPDLRPKTQEQAQRHARRALVFVDAVYFAYSIGSTWWRLSRTPNFYQLLGFPTSASINVSSEVWESSLKSVWRRLTLRFHPDKLRQGATPEVEQHFVFLRAAYEGLNDPIRKTAYERFGPSLVASCTQHKCRTIRDWHLRGLQLSVGFWIVMLGVFLLMSLLGRATFAPYWRYVSLAAAVAIEASVLTSPSDVTTAVTGLLPFEQVLFLHHLFITWSCMLTQVGPVLFPEQLAAQRSPREELQQIMPLMGRLRQALVRNEAEIRQSTLNDIVPVVRASKSEEAAMAQLSDSVVDALCDNRIKHSHKEVWLEALKGVHKGCSHSEGEHPSHTIVKEEPDNEALPASDGQKPMEGSSGRSLPTEMASISTD